MRQPPGPTDQTEHAIVDHRGQDPTAGIFAKLHHRVSVVPPMKRPPSRLRTDFAGKDQALSDGTKHCNGQLVAIMAHAPEESSDKLVTQEPEAAPVRPQILTADAPAPTVRRFVDSEFREIPLRRAAEFGSLPFFVISLTAS